VICYILQTLMTRRASRVGAWLPGALTTLALSVPWRNASAQRLDLRWHAPEGCPTADFIESEVARIVGLPWASIESSWREVSASVETRGNTFLLHVDLVAANGATSERRVSAASCTEAGEAVVAILTTGVAPHQRRPEAERPAGVTLPPVDAEPVTIADRVDASEAEPRAVPLTPVLGASLGMDFGTLPAPAPFAQLNIGLEWGRLAALAFVGATSPVLGEIDGAIAGAEVSLIMSGLLGCVRVIESRVSPVACAGIELGSLEASGYGTSAGRDGSAFWSAGLARGALDVAISDASTVSLGVTAVVPFRHLRVVLQPEEVHRTPTIAARPWLGLGVRFR
jgi:hypothetical protein